MKEQAPSSLGGETAAQPTDEFERTFGMSREKLDEVLAERKFYDFWLGHAISDIPTYEANRRAAIESIDTCLKLFGLEGGSLVDAFDDSSSSSRDWNPIRRSEVQAASAESKSIGELYFHRAYMSLDIEGDEWSYVDLGPMEFSLSNNRSLTISVSGDFWTNYTYKHPTTGEPFFPREEEVFSIEDATGLSLELLDSEIGHALSFEGRIRQN